MDAIHKAQYKVCDLNTASVTLFPTRAQIWREIKGVELKRGTNEITIVGLSPTVDQDSIKVEGTGSATITDIAVELLPNRDIFEEMYPDDDDDESDSEDEEGEDEDVRDPIALCSAKSVLADLENQLERAKDDITSALRRMQILDDYGKADKDDVVIQDVLLTYKVERAKAFEDHLDGKQRQEVLDEAIEKAERKVEKLQKQEDRKRAKENKEKEKARKEKEKKRAKQERRKEEEKKEKPRIRKEREKFWPRFCYSVRISLEVSAFTPMSSRRASISSLVTTPEITAASEVEVEGKGDISLDCDLRLSYVTAAAFWSPVYDLQLSTTTATASLYFDAMLKNFTSETWSNCKITLSTSETTLAGLEDAIPTLVPWRIKLVPKGSLFNIDSDILRSQEEQHAHVDNQRRQRSTFVEKSWSQMFGVDRPRVVPYSSRAVPMAAMRRPAPPQSRSLFDDDVPLAARPAPANAEPQHGTSAFFGSAAPAAPGGHPTSGGLFGSALRQPFAAQAQQLTQQVQIPQQRTMAEDSPESETDQQPDLDFRESLMEDTGLTATYDLPGLKTLAPKSAGSKQGVARVKFPNVALSHTVVAKYKPVAYLKAKIKNNSKLTLLKGQAGLTLDGTFMGKTSLPRCSAGESFSLSLGVDPAIKVLYPKPDVRRATSGLFNKDNSSVYTRTITLHNSRVSAGRAVSLLVLDQIPVSEDERLRVELIDPRGLSIGTDGVVAGGPGREAREDKDWGKASAKLKKGGEVSWEVSLNAGKAVKLSLEYAVSMPSGDFAVQC